VGNHEMNLSDPQINFSNVWSEDPAFAGEEAEYPFSLLESSIAIDAGVMNFEDYLPADFEFPETDLAGNPRISSSGIDLGAYEFQQEVFAPQSEIEEALAEQIIVNYPNPGRLDYSKNIATKISLNLPQSGNYQLSIYNIKGQKVRQILDAYLAKGKSTFSWDGRDANNRLVGSGNYLVKLTRGEEVIATHQLLMVK
jgi:hypothetical protein